MDAHTLVIADLERRLAESEARHRLLVESWAQAVWETDAAGIVVADSPSWRAYTGQTLEQWLGYGWLDAIHPDDRAYAERQWREAVNARTLVNAEFRLRSPNGGWRWTNIRAAPVLDAEGGVAKWLGWNIDIEDRKRAEQALRESEEKFRILFESIDEGICILEMIEDGDGNAVDFRYVEANEEHDRQAGLGYVIGKLASEVVPNAEAYWFETFGEVARTGESKRYENYNRDTGHWYDIFLSRVGGAGSRRVCVVSHDSTERKQREERQAFLLKLVDALRPLADPVEVQSQAASAMGRHFGAGRAAYAEIDPDGAHFTVHRDYTDGVPSFAGRYPLGDYGTDVLWANLVAGRTNVIADAERDVRLGEAERSNYAASMVRAAVGVPLVKGGRLAATFFVHLPSPHDWRPDEVALVEETAERTWAAVERARAEAALRESEERFQQFAAASAAGLWIRDAGSLSMEFASAAIGTIYGLEPHALLGDVKRWAAMIVPEDRETAIQHLETARTGDTAVHEFRIQRASDGSFRWIRNTDFPLREDGYIQRVGGITEDVTETRQLTEHQGVLLAELQHRVRNIMGMIRSMANRTAPGAASVEDYRSLLEGRLLALARVQALLMREANAGSSLRTIIESEVATQAHHVGQFVLTGPDLPLAPKTVEVLTLAFHEPATNALKYGALSVPEGRLHVTWTPTEKRGRPWLALDWIEEGAPPREPSTRRGFGSELIEARIPYELGGRGKITIGPEGMRCHLEFPLKEGESILETDAPQPATVFGGSLDMTGAPDLTGRTVLVVEDDYYMASDTAAALRGAGAEVLGPCPSADATRDLLDDETPTHAVLDLNLGGGGPRFEIAHLLKARGIPFVFLTGYDPDVIPTDLDDVVRLQKPVPFRTIIEAVSQL